MRLAAHSHSLWSPLLTLPGRTALPGPSRRTVHLSSTVARPSGSLPAPHLPASPSSASSSSTTPSPPPPPASAPASAPAPSSGPRRPRNPTYPQPAPPARGEVPPYLRHPVGVPLAPSELAEKPTRPPRVEKEKAKTIKAPPLPRPLGSVVPPEASSKTWDGELRGEERHLADRGNMIRDAGRSFYYDLHSARKSDGGKLWTAPEVLIREDMARYFPNIAGTNLLNQPTNTTDLLKGGISIVAILGTRLSEEQVEHWTKATLEDQAGRSNFRYIQINYQENTLKSILSSFFTSSVKRTVPEDRWGNYLMAKTGWTEIDITGPLGVGNKFIGYLYLVDANCRIRWAACGPPQKFEIESLRLATTVLMRRMRENDPSKVATVNTTPVARATG